MVMNAENANQVQRVCQELLEGKRSGKINQEMLEYELAKISLEFLNDYRLLSMPSKPQTIYFFEGLRQEEITRMGRAEYENKKQNYEDLRKAWRLECEKVKAANQSRLLWLRMMRDALKKKEHPAVFEVQTLINGHETGEL